MSRTLSVNALILASATVCVGVCAELTAQDPPSEASPKVEYVAITGGTVHIGTGQLMQGATVLLANDKIERVGPGIHIPEGATIIDATGKHVSPGFVIINARGMGSGGTADNPADSVNPFDPQMKMGLAAGITSFQTLTGSGNGRPGGSSTVFKLAYGDIKGMVLAQNKVAAMSAPLNIAQIKALKDAVEAAKTYQQEKAEFDAAEDPQGREPRAPQGAEQLLDIMAGKIKLWVSLGGGGGGRGQRGGGRGGGRGNPNDSIRQALEISRIMGVGVVLQDPITAWSMANEVAATGSMVLLNPRQNVDPDPAHPNTTGSNIAMAHILSEAGVAVAVHSPGSSLGTGGMLGNDLHTPHIDAAFAVRGGLAREKGLRTLTLDAAVSLGVDDRIGSLESGKDADVLILDGDPLHYKTFVETAFVNGKIVYEKAAESLYNHIKR